MCAGTIKSFCTSGRTMAWSLSCPCVYISWVHFVVLLRTYCPSSIWTGWRTYESSLQRVSFQSQTYVSDVRVIGRNINFPPHQSIYMAGNMPSPQSNWKLCRHGDGPIWLQCCQWQHYDESNNKKKKREEEPLQTLRIVSTLSNQFPPIFTVMQKNKSGNKCVPASQLWYTPKIFKVYRHSPHESKKIIFNGG